MKVEAHVMAWNEAETIHLTIKHYQKFCDRIVLHDNFSTDNTREIALELGCDVRLFGTKGVLDDREYTKLKNNCWKHSDADWVIVVDADEILYLNNPDPKKLLKHYLDTGYSIVQPIGWQVMSHELPKYDWLEITNGYYYKQYAKLCCFSPRYVSEINYIHGCHVANPVFTGRMIDLGTLFHYRNVGGHDRLINRHKLYRDRLSDWNKRFNAGGHYLHEDSQRIKDWDEQYNKSGRHISF